MKKRILLGIAVVLVAGAIVIANVKREAGKVASVQAEKAARRSLTSLVTASGRIQPKREVKVSATRMGRVTRLAVAEGDVVAAGDFLLEIDPAPYRSAVARLRAGLESARATLAVHEAQEKQSRLECDRVLALAAAGLASAQERDKAETACSVAAAQVAASRQTVREAEALLDNADHELSEVTVRSEIDGIITRVNVEEGETAIVGTMNNPGTELLRIADLSQMEAEIEVDETEVVEVALGQPAKVTIDSYPDTSFVGVVTEIGNSAIIPIGGTQDESVDFKVVVTLTDTVPGVRPGLTAKAEITVARRDSVVAVPIQALTVRRESALREAESAERGRRDAAAAEEDASRADEDDEIEGLFIVDRGRARFRPVETGVSSDKHFEIVSGLDVGEMIVTGDFKTIRELKPNQRVKISKKESNGKKGS
jgi:HlyD family secretion protein